MVDVRFFLRDGRFYGFDACGHALHAPKGQDIVCAGISALLQSAAGYLEHKNVPVIRVKSSRYMVRVKRTATDDNKRLASEILEAAYGGIESIAESYPGNVRLHLCRGRQSHV